MITPGTILFCVSVAGLLFTLVWLLVGIARRKKREERIAREAMAGSAAFRRTDPAVSSIAEPPGKTEYMSTQDTAAQAQTEIVEQQTGPVGNAAKQGERMTESMFDQAINTARSLEATEIVADGQTEGFADSSPMFKYCENCGEKMKVADRFCANCGTDMI
jgi:NADH pyrophosphatase NudC (nudix superfamily)